MKMTIKSFSAVLFALAAVACSSPEKMAEMAENLTVGCEPAVLEVTGGKIDADVTVTYPADFFPHDSLLQSQYNFPLWNISMLLSMCQRIAFKFLIDSLISFILAS